MWSAAQIIDLRAAVGCAKAACSAEFFASVLVGAVAFGIAVAVGAGLHAVANEATAAIGKSEAKMILWADLALYAAACVGGDGNGGLTDPFLADGCAVAKGLDLARQSAALAVSCFLNAIALGSAKEITGFAQGVLLAILRALAGLKTAGCAAADLHTFESLCAGFLRRTLFADPCGGFVHTTTGSALLVGCTGGAAHNRGSGFTCPLFADITDLAIAVFLTSVGVGRCRRIRVFGDFRRCLWGGWCFAGGFLFGEGVLGGVVGCVVCGGFGCGFLFGGGCFGRWGFVGTGVCDGGFGGSFGGTGRAHTREALEIREAVRVFLANAAKRLTRLFGWCFV